MPLSTSAESPVPVRKVAQMIGQWISRLGRIWVEGQITQVSRRPGASILFLTLRDPAADISVSVTCPWRVVEAIQPPLADGARVVVHARPEYYIARGTLSLAAEEIRPVGIGELLMRLEQLKRVLAAEGLFDTRHKIALPFLPRTVGLVCGRGSAAERDVLENARRRWPAVRFQVLPVAVQGPSAVAEIVDAIGTLDRDRAVDVIVVARGGGSVEDLLPFSDETLLRAVFTCRTPVVSAIGHEQDTPLLDLVADVRASTPTDAARKVVPDVGEQLALIHGRRERARRAMLTLLARERASLDAIRNRPVLAAPGQEVDRRATDLDALVQRARRCVAHRLDRAAGDVEHTRARVLALSPAATLNRGYAIVQREDGLVVRAPCDVTAGDLIQIRLASDGIGATVSRQG